MSKKKEEKVTEPVQEEVTEPVQEEVTEEAVEQEAPAEPEANPWERNIIRSTIPICGWRRITTTSASAP